MIIIRNKKTNKKHAINLIIKKYRTIDLDANEDSVKLLKKELNENMEDYAKVILKIDEVIKTFKKKYPNEI